MIALSLLLLLGLLPPVARALDICLPTANDNLLKPGREADFFQPTAEGTLASGMFGCVRRGGRRFHEGIDIQSLQRDRNGESTDSVHAVSDGEVAFINTRPGLSNYGRYIVLQHRWDGVQVFTLYAHLRAVADGLVVGQPVKKGQRIATLGRSTNTREGIPKERAHLHFEINFMLNPNFRLWHAKRHPKAPPFGNFNGQNFIGIDPAALYRAFAANRELNFADYINSQPIAFSLLLGARPIPWIAMHPEQLRPATLAGRVAVVAYEIGVTSWGLPVAVWPRTAAELTEAQRRTLQRGRAVLKRVNEAELGRSNCRGLLKRNPRGAGWLLSHRGHEWAELLTYAP